MRCYTTNHVCVSLQRFKETKSLLDISFTLRLGNETLVLVEVVGYVHLYFDEFKWIVLRNYFYVPNFRRILLSVAFLFKYSYSISFNEKVIICKTNLISVVGWGNCEVLHVVVVYWLNIWSAEGWINKGTEGCFDNRYQRMLR